MSIVIDASIALSWALPDEAVDGVDAVLRNGAIGPFWVPAHWRAEIANALLMSERKKRVTVEQVARLITMIEALEITVDNEGMHDALRRALPIARAHGLTVYDALYLELAERTGRPLASLDSDLLAAAKKVGVTVLP
ncbi:MAG: type II toxin-antitoxin system VapC family toxin [Sphingomonadaceae bacterium]